MAAQRSLRRRLSTGQWSQEQNTRRAGAMRVDANSKTGNGNSRMPMVLRCNQLNLRDEVVGPLFAIVLGAPRPLKKACPREGDRGAEGVAGPSAGEAVEEGAEVVNYPLLNIDLVTIACGIYRNNSVGYWLPIKPEEPRVQTMRVVPVKHVNTPPPLRAHSRCPL